jgi:hypothetical protein
MKQRIEFPSAPPCKVVTKIWFLSPRERSASSNSIHEKKSCLLSEPENVFYVNTCGERKDVTS